MLKKRLLSRSRTVTLPDERYRAVRAAESFLQRLAGGVYPRVPKAVREEAAAVLRHYPNKWELDIAASDSPDIFQEKMEPLHRMVAAYAAAEETTCTQNKN
jgi:hypothetical protein